MPTYQATVYGHKEVQFNIWSHGLGFVLMNAVEND